MSMIIAITIQAEDDTPSASSLTKAVSEVIGATATPLPGEDMDRDDSEVRRFYQRVSTILE